MRGSSARFAGGPRAWALSRVVAVVLLSTGVPWFVSSAALAQLGPGRHEYALFHAALELVGSCIAVGVAVLLLLRARYEKVAPHVWWVVAALVSMGLLDGIHGMLPFGVAWSYLRHTATLVGGLLFGLVWLPLPRFVHRRKGAFVLLVVGLSLTGAVAIWSAAGALPPPWSPDGYAWPVKVLNALGGLGFASASVFFLRRYLRQARREDLVFAAHTLLFGAASFFFGFSHVWAVDWWVWHGLRLGAYVVILIAAHQTVVTLYQRADRHAQELSATNLALEAEIVERARAQAELQEHRDRLEELVGERTQALLEADRRKDEFLAVLSHELRNPLAPISNSVRVLERAPGGGEQAQRALKTIGRQVKHVTRLIDDLLDATRIARGKIRLMCESLELNEVVRGTGEDLRAVFSVNRVGLEISVPEEPLRARGDRTRLAQVVGNLLQNAAKFTPPGGRARLSLRRGEQGQAVVEVRDDGAGIQPELLPQLFAPFVQADRTLARSNGGLGLGLALVKGLVDLHGGSVEAASGGPGAGSVFTVRLPLEEAAASSCPNPEPGLLALAGAHR